MQKKVVIVIENQFRFIYMAIYFAMGSLYSLLSLHLSTIGYTGTQIGIIVASGSLLIVIAQPLWGILCDFSKRPILVFRLTLLFAAGLCLLLAKATVFIYFLIVYVIMHFFQAAHNPLADALAIKVSETTGKGFGIYRQYGSIGFALSVLLVGFASEQYGTGIIFAFYFFAYLFAAIFFHPQLTQQDNPDSAEKLSPIIALASLFKSSRFNLVLISSFFVFGPFIAHNNYFSLLYVAIGGTVAGIGVAFLLFAGSEAPVMKYSQAVINKLGLEKVMLLAATISCVRWLWYGSGPSPLMITLLFILQGISVGLYIIAAAQLVNDCAIGDQKVTAMTVYSSLGIGLGGIFSQLIGGVLIDLINVQAVYYFFAASTAIGIMFLIKLTLTPCELGS